MLKRLCLLAVALAAFAPAPGCEKNEFVPPPPPTVTVAKPVQRDVTIYMDISGRLQAVEEVHIPARVSGYLAAIHYQDGQIVKAGDPLFTIEQAPYEAALAKAQADVATREAELKLAEVALDKIKQVIAKGAASEIELLNAQAQRDAALAKLNAAKADADRAQLDLDYTNVKSPINGVTSDSNFDVGDQVGGLTTATLTTVVLQDPIHAYFDVGERGVVRFTRQLQGGIKPQVLAPVRLQLSDGSDYPHEGKVDFIDNAVNPQTGTLRMRAKFPNPQGVLLPGLFARIRYPNDVAGAVLVPESAVQRDLAGYFVLTVNGQSKVERIDVQVGRQNGPLRVIESGLSPDQSVIVKGLQRARLGAQVKVEQTTIEALEKPADQAPSDKQPPAPTPNKTDDQSEPDKPSEANVPSEPQP